MMVGDGAAGGGVSLSGTWWDKEALAIAEIVSRSFDGDLTIYAFKTLSNATIQVHIEKSSTKWAFTKFFYMNWFCCDVTTFRRRCLSTILEGCLHATIVILLQLACISLLISLHFVKVLLLCVYIHAKTLCIAEDTKVSSPSVEMAVQIPNDLDRFKDRPMYVKYVSEAADTGLSRENDGIFKLVSFDSETNSCTWCLANVRVNREKAGKGRSMSKKQREWRLSTPFDCLRSVRLCSET
ncbi:hypothetical protein Ancab_038102 [Ancistrocladus abbreviatus]